MSDSEFGDGLKAGVNGRIAGHMDDEAVRPPVGDFDRAAVPGDPPVPGAQWDELYRRWEIWDDAAQDWVAVGDDLGASIAPGDENPLPAHLSRVTLAADDLAIEHVPTSEHRQAEPDDAPAGAQWNEVLGRWERWDAAYGDWVEATAQNEPD
jgi:hypothetical protein